jgi:hypothetical protein
MASTTLPPRSSVLSPDTEASEWPETTIPLVPYTGDREIRTPAKLSCLAMNSPALRWQS